MYIYIIIVCVLLFVLMSLSLLLVVVVAVLEAAPARAELGPLRHLGSLGIRYGGLQWEGGAVDGGRTI